MISRAPVRPGQRSPATHYRPRPSVWRRALLITAIQFFAFITLSHAEEAASGHGPLRLTNQGPISLLFLHFQPEAPRVSSKGELSGSLDMAYTNSLLSQTALSTGFAGLIDMEMLRMTLNLSYGLPHNMEAGAEIPFMYTTGGFMDSFIENVEDLFSNVRRTRTRLPHNQFVYDVRGPAQTLFRGEDHTFGIGDIVLKVKGRIWEEKGSRPALSWRGGLKLPTGDEDVSFGSGEADGGFGLMAQKSYKKLTLYANGDIIFAGQPLEEIDGFNISFRPIYSLMTAFEYNLTPAFSLVLQFDLLTKPFEDTGLDMLDYRVIEAVLGFNWLIRGEWLLQAGMVEDSLASQNAGGDVTFFLNAGARF